MRCPFCSTDDDRVVDSRTIGEGNVIRRRRECVTCGKRFTTYERTEVVPRQVIKKDSSRETFSREKILGGLMRACEKRNINIEQMENIVSRVEGQVFEEHDTEVSTSLIGEKVSEALRDVDHVAYVRFASVYRDFKDVEEFLQEVLALAHAGGKAPQPGGASPAARIDQDSSPPTRGGLADGFGVQSETTDTRRGGRGW